METLYHYEVHMPVNREAGKKYPVLFALHGRGSDERDILQLTAPLMERFVVIGVRGNRPLGPGYQYYELKSIGNPVMETFHEAVRNLEDFVEKATAEYPIDPDNRFLLGFSQGAIMSMTLALRMGRRLRGIAALNGYVPDFVKPEAVPDVKEVSVFISHGEKDPIFPIHIGHETAEFFRTVTPDCTFKTYPTGHGVSEENLRDLVEWLESKTK